ncbi:MAG: aminotransferase class V-fold PLP-dependent enzyme [Alphaproteobacteria bacterium]
MLTGRASPGPRQNTGVISMLTRPDGNGVAVRPFDVERVRADFPILSEKVYGKPLVYLDSAASAQKPVQVMDAMTDMMRTGYANVHRGLHYMSNAATQAFEEARSKTRAFINAAHDEEIIFTANATDAYNLVAYSYAMERFGPGDEIVLSIMEHHSNIVPWHMLRERKGVVLKWAPITEEGALDLDAFEDLLGPRTKLVALTHMSNVLGTVTPAKRIVEIAHRHGVPVLFDGAQSAVHMPVDVQEIGCDFYAFTAHKLYGPTGIGVLYGRKDLLNAMRPFRGGGEMIEEVHTDRVIYGNTPQRFEAGTPAIVESVGLAAAIDYVQGWDREAALAHEHDLLAYATERLQALDWITLYGTAPGKGSIVAFNVEGAHAHDVSTIIDHSGVALRAGHHCAQPLMEHFGVNSTLRASFAMYNTRAEVDVLVEALEKARDLLS